MTDDDEQAAPKRRVFLGCNGDTERTARTLAALERKRMTRAEVLATLHELEQKRRPT